MVFAFLRKTAGISFANPGMTVFCWTVLIGMVIVLQLAGSMADPSQTDPYIFNGYDRNLIQ